MDNLLTAANAAGVGHAVILSIVGTDQVPGLVYYRAKVLQEDILKAGPVPYSCSARGTAMRYHRSHC